MRKIRYKIIILGAIFSLLLMAFALLSSYIIFEISAKRTMNNDINSALGRVVEDYTTNSSKDVLAKVVKNILNVYNENPDNETEFESIEDEYEYFKNSCTR